MGFSQGCSDFEVQDEGLHVISPLLCFLPSFPLRQVLTVLLLPVGASDAGAGPGDVHPFRHWGFSGAVHIHEELGHQPTRQEEQKAARLHLPHQK